MDKSTNTCEECSWFADDADCAKCEECHAIYHKACINIPETDSVSLNWRCGKCQNKSENKSDMAPLAKSLLTDVPKDNDSTQDLVDDKDSVQEALLNHFQVPEPKSESEPITEQEQKDEVPIQGKEFNLVMEELKALRNDIKTSIGRMELEMASIKLCVHTCISRIDSLETRLFTSVDRTSVQNQNITEHADEVIESTRCDVSDYDQEILGSDNIESDMPELEEVNNSTPSQLDPIATKPVLDRSLVVVRPYSTTDHKMEQTIEPYVGKQYKLKSSENFEEYLKYIGVGLIGRKTASAVTPISVLSRTGDTYTFTMATMIRTVAFSFKFNEEFDEERPDGCQLRSRMTADGNETTAEGWNHTCIRVYEAI